MCGIAGAFAELSHSADEARVHLTAMCAVLNHRGPDDSGFWTDDTGRVALGHRRLSIIDVSPEGHQPMISPSGRYVITFNGEVYNHRTLRPQLSGVVWRGQSDTETMLAAIDQWGIEAAVRRFVGMFAFAIWDRHEELLWLVRD